ncbi:MAG: hypothetical protein H0V44_09815 [Planctomycetes bacterium]|nr:hypothetical protein [Planctomycetota bacterium]
MLHARVVLTLFALSASLAAADPESPDQKPLPPSPSLVSGERIWPEPCFSHWPAIAYTDESRNVVFALPNRTAGQAGTIGWRGAEALPFTTPTDTDRVSGLLPLPLAPGPRSAVVKLGDKESAIELRICEARDAWPIAALKDGFPVDERGVPVVLLDRRRNANDERKWLALHNRLARPSGRGLLVGDPLEALGGNAWSEADADQRPALDDRYPHHAVLVALARIGSPRTIAWCPGNQALLGAAWNEEEVRILGAVRTRCEALKILPRLVLIVPPLPIDERLRELAVQRRELLISSATVQDWAIIDLERVAGPAERANKVGDGLFTRYPVGDAQAQVRKALREEMAR